MSQDCLNCLYCVKGTCNNPEAREYANKACRKWCPDWASILEGQSVRATG